MVRLGVGKRRLILLLSLVVVMIIMIRLPVVDAVDEYKYVDGLSSAETTWSTTGVSPYLDAQDDGNEIDTSGNGVISSWYTFDQTTGSGSGFTVVFSIYHDSTSDSYIEWELDWTGDGTAEASGSFTTNLGLVWEDDSEDLSALDTQAEIDACRVRFTSNKGVGGPDNVMIDAARLYITGGVAGNDYTAYPSGDFTLTGDTSLIADFVKTLIEGFSLAGITSLLSDFVKTLAEGFALAGDTSLISVFVKTLIEGFALSGTTNIFVIIQKIISEGFALSGNTSLAISYSVLLAVGFVLTGVVLKVVDYSVKLSVGFSLGGTVAVAVAYVKTLIEGFSLASAISAFKVLIVKLQESFSAGVGTTIEKIAGTALIGSLFYQLFLGLNMWGYLGPIVIVIGGYLVMVKNRNLGIIWLIVEYLIMAHYFTLLEATPGYWWHIVILLLGSLSTCFYVVGKRG